MNSDERTISAKLERLSALVFARDPAIVDELWSGPGFDLYGSEQGERAETRDELVALFANLFAKPYRVCWTWEKTRVKRHGDLAWVCAESQLVVTHSDRTTRNPHRLTGVLQKVGDDWRWRLFSGSEPALPADP
jgi:N-dimethylarginine dimethylaminohydrolase